MSETASMYDIIIVGAGPGGYVAAIRAGQLGLRVALVEERTTPGGTCLNIGCIPSKALLHTAHDMYNAQHTFKRQGIHIQDITLSVPEMMAHKQGVVDSLTQGVQFLLKKNKVTWIQGRATLSRKTTDFHTVIVQTDKGKTTPITAPFVILATGSEPITIPSLPVGESPHIVDSTGALSFDERPEHLVVVGGGYIGLELGSAWHALGSRVTVVEAMPTITPSMDGAIQKALLKLLSSRGMAFQLNTKITGCESHETGVTLTLEHNDQTTENLTCDKVLVSVGRRPVTQGLNLEELSIQTDARGFIRVSDAFETTCTGVFAIGDVIGGMMLAHKAEEDGILLIEALHALLTGRLSKIPHLHPPLIPAVIFTQPEVSCVGLNEEQARLLIKANTEKTELPQNLIQKGQVQGDLSHVSRIKIGEFPFSANSLSKATHQTEGFVKIIADADTDRVIGAHIIGSHAGALIAEITTAMAFYASSEDIARICHAHPTMSEGVKEAAWATFAKALHS